MELAIVYWDIFDKKYAIENGLANKDAVEKRLARLSCGNPFFRGYVTTSENSEFVADYVNVSHLVQAGGQPYPYTTEQDEDFDSRFIGSFTYRKTTRGQRGLNTPNWKWTSGVRWAMAR